ncbi:MAG: hypothetical protein ACXVPU_06875 [Bacteroidia bacterium]
MNRIIIFLLLVCSSVVGQDLKLIKATKQIINSGASSNSTTDFLILFKKGSAYKWSIDSVVNVNTMQSVNYTLSKADDPSFKPVKSFSKSDKGTYQITFASMRSRGSGRPNSPTGIKVELPDFPKGAIIYYRVGKKKKQLLVEAFEELETINAP